MSSILAPLALAISTGALLAIPLTPAIRELVSKRDAGPLVTRKDDGKIDNFAKSLRARCEVFQPWLERCSARSRNELLDLAEGRLLVIGTEGPWDGAKQTDVLVLCARRTELPDSFRSLKDFYCKDSVRTGHGNVFRALLSDADIALGNGTQILRWVHAESHLAAARDCVLFGRASAGKSMTLSPEIRFERIHAPVIYSAAEAAGMVLRSESAPFSKLAQAGMGRTRVHGLVHLVREEEHYGDLVATKRLELEESACVFGSVKANGDVYLHERAEVDGSVVSTKRIYVSPGCFIKGPIIAEHEIVINPGVQVGLAASPTTVSAPRIRIAPGSVLHGTVWARVEGRVGD